MNTNPKLWRRARRGRVAERATAGTETPAVMSRRRFLGYSGVVGAAGAATALVPGGFTVVTDPALIASPGAPTLKFHTYLRRFEDQLRVKIEFWNLQITASDHLVKDDETKPAYLVYDFGAQHLADEAYFTTSGMDGSAQDYPAGEQPPGHPVSGSTEPLKAAGQVGARLSGDSRLAFEVPESTLPLEYSLASLLNWLPLQPRLVPTALQPGEVPTGAVPAPRAPSETETAIEYPWHLVLSPHARSAWAHATEPVDHATGRYELWHTRLAVRGQNDHGAAVVDEDDEDGRALRAVWSTDKSFATHVNAANPPVALDSYSPFRMSLSPRDRLDIVKLSSDFRLMSGRLSQPDDPAVPGDQSKPFVPEVVEIDKLALTSLGGYLTSSFVNELVYQQGTPLNPKYNTSLLQWHHVGAMGRDAYARVVRKGWLFPFGYKAALITVTERRFDRPPPTLTIPNPPRGAYLRQLVFVVVLKADRDFGSGPAAVYIQHEGRQLPFRRLACLTRVTPDLDDPAADPVPYVSPANKNVFMPKVGQTPFRFHMRGIDWAGRAHRFDVPVVFVDDTKAYASGDVAGYLGGYHETTSLDGSRLALAAETESRPGDTTFPVGQLTFMGQTPEPYEPNELARLSMPAFFPAMEQASAVLSDAGTVAGRDLDAIDVKYADRYLMTVGGFGPGNRGEVFLETTAPAPGSVGVSTRNAGGIAAPALPVRSVSRILGPTGPAGPSARTSPPASRTVCSTRPTCSTTA